MDSVARTITFFAVVAIYVTLSQALPLDNSWPPVRYQRIYFPDNLPSLKKHQNPWAASGIWQPISFPTMGGARRPTYSNPETQRIIFNDDEGAIEYVVPYSWLERWLKMNMPYIEKTEDPSDDNDDDREFPKDYKRLQKIFSDISNEQAVNDLNDL